MKFEVRMTAYDRPTMLLRSLNSLQSQTYPQWNAIVYDDSSNSASREVVEALGDLRIQYRRNPQRLGAVGNVDQCFSPAPVFGGEYACLLEDDNFWFPGLLAAVADSLSKQPWEIVQTNQRIFDRDSGFGPENETTRGDWFPAGKISPLELRARLLFMEGVSNSGLVWKLGGTDLRLKGTVVQAALNEYCRSLLVDTPFLFIEKPHGAYTMIPRSESARANDGPRAITRGMREIHRYILKMHGTPLVDAARRVAASPGRIERLIAALAYSGHPRRAWRLATGYKRVITRALAKGAAVRLIERNPCAAFFASGRLPFASGNGAGSR